MAKKRIRINVVNWDIEFMRDIINKNGFLVTEPATFQLDDEKKKSLHGIRSILFGTSYSDENAFMERHSCECGAFKGKIFEGEICPICNKEVKDAPINLKYTAWISLHGNYIITPYYYNKLKDLIGKSIFPQIVEAKSKVDVNGILTLASPEEIIEKPKHPFVGIGIIQFQERFDEILDYFKSKKKKKAKEFDRMKASKMKVFASHIPVYTTAIRPESTTSDTYYYNPIDKKYNPIFNLSEKIKNCEEIEKMFYLQSIQAKLNELWDINFDMISGKDKVIRGLILGGSLDYTARNVIVPDPTLKDDECIINYYTALELFKFKVIYYIMKMKNILLSEAYNDWVHARVEFDKNIYDIMLYMLQQEKMRILINRNPTLNYYSILLMRIKTISNDPDDYTLAIPLAILPGLNADFDGETYITLSTVMWIEKLCELLGNVNAQLATA